MSTKDRTPTTAKPSAPPQGLPDKEELARELEENLATTDPVEHEEKKAERARKVRPSKLGPDDAVDAPPLKRDGSQKAS